MNSIIKIKIKLQPKVAALSCGCKVYVKLIIYKTSRIKQLYEAAGFDDLVAKKTWFNAD